MPLKRLTLIKSLTLGHSWYTEKAKGSVQLTRHIKMRAYGGLLPDNLLAAVALSQACRELGCGMVYCLFGDAVSSLDDDDDTAVAHGLQDQAPGLFYVPEQWTAARKADWDKLLPWEQVQRCWGPYGWVDGDVPGLPVDVSGVSPEAATAGTLKLSSENTVAVLMAPYLYVGMAGEMMKHCQATTHSALTPAGGQVSISSYHVPSWSRFDQWRQPNMRHVVQELRSICRRSPELSVRRDFMDHKLQVARQAAMPILRRVEAAKVVALQTVEERRKNERQQTLVAREAVWRGAAFEEVHAALRGPISLPGTAPTVPTATATAPLSMPEPAAKRVKTKK